MRRRPSLPPVDGRAVPTRLRPGTGANRGDLRARPRGAECRPSITARPVAHCGVPGPRVPARRTMCLRRRPVAPASRAFRGPARCCRPSSTHADNAHPPLHLPFSLHISLLPPNPSQRRRLNGWRSSAISTGGTGASTPTPRCPDASPRLRAERAGRSRLRRDACGAQARRLTRRRGGPAGRVRDVAPVHPGQARRHEPHPAQLALQDRHHHVHRRGDGPHARPPASLPRSSALVGAACGAGCGR